MAIVVPRVRELHIRRGQKIALFGIVSLGWLVVVASIVRVVRFSALLQSPDPAWASYDISIWTDVEVNVGIICACRANYQTAAVKVPAWAYGEAHKPAEFAEIHQIQHIKQLFLISAMT